MKTAKPKNQMLQKFQTFLYFQHPPQRIRPEIKQNDSPKLPYGSSDGSIVTSALNGDPRTAPPVIWSNKMTWNDSASSGTRSFRIYNMGWKDVHSLIMNFSSINTYAWLSLLSWLGFFLSVKKSAKTYKYNFLIDFEMLKCKCVIFQGMRILVEWKHLKSLQ